MTVVRNTGADLLPLHSTRPSYPGARLRAMRDAQARRERENAQQPYDADRLRRDLAARPPDVRVNDGDGDEATRVYLRRMGWTNERYDRATADLRERLQGRVHPRVAATVTAGGGTAPRRGVSSTPPAVSSFERLGKVAQHVAAARAAGIDPVAKWPSLRGLLASASPERTRSGLAPGVAASSSPFGGSTTSGPVRRALGGRERRRS
jgi:hypothetical protein